MVGKELTRTTITTLYLIKDKHRTVLLGQFAERLHKIRSWYMDTTTTLDTLDDNSRYIAFGEFLLYGEGVVEVQESHLVALVEWCLYLWIIGHCHRTASAPVETAMESYHTALARMERCEFEGVLVALSTGVIEKKGVILVA